MALWDSLLYLVPLGWWSLLAPTGANAKQFGARGDDSAVVADMTAEEEAEKAKIGMRSLYRQFGPKGSPAFGRKGKGRAK